MLWKYKCVHLIYMLNVSDSVLLKMQISSDCARIIGKRYVFNFKYFGLVTLWDGWVLLACHRIEYSPICVLWFRRWGPGTCWRDKGMWAKLHSTGHVRGNKESVSFMLHFWDMFDSMSLCLVYWRSMYLMSDDRAHFYVS